LAAEAVDAGVRPALVFAAVVVAIGGVLTFFIPRTAAAAGLVGDPSESAAPSDLDATLLS
jgi:hypothetical protein